MVVMAIKRAILICGSQSALAKSCGVSQQTVGKWLKGGGISTVYVGRIIEATQGQVTLEDLCPDIAQAVTKSKTMWVNKGNLPWKK